TVAGGGPKGTVGDGGPATGADLTDLAGVAVGPDGRVYVSEAGRIRVVSLADGVISTFAGNGTAGHAGDGLPATTASVYGKSGLATDPSGHVYLAEPDSHRIRRVTGPDPVAPVVTLTSLPRPEGPDREATVAFTVDDPTADVVCSLDGGVGASCASPWRGENLGVGPHTLVVTATDPAGNAGSATATWRVLPSTSSDPTAAAATTWLARELARGDGLLDRAGVPDPGLTTDALLAVTA
ncbi:hypothetical protein GT354_13370, partial [Streptomyces sp. SID3343]|nr:hypothetical protein [Streptomyces sp. SID3343]